MLLYLAELLARVESAFNVFGYLTFRAILGALTALLISLIVGPWMIRRLSFHQIGQQVRSHGPESHLPKAGTPTMGGTLILVAVAASTLLWADLANRFVWIVLSVMLAFGLIGFYDDYRKLVLGDSKGLAARWKYLWQSVGGIAAGVAFVSTAQDPAIEQALIVPFFKDVLLPLGVGMVLRLTVPSLADRIGDPLLKIAGATMALIAIGILILGVRLVLEVGLPSLLAFGAFTLAAIVTGHWLGGPNPADRSSLAMACASRHIGLALLIAAHSPGRRALALVVTYLLASAIVSIPYLRWLKRRHSLSR